MTALRILFLDVATRTGYAYGEAGRRPMSGSFRVAKQGATQSAHFGNALRWITSFHQEHPFEVLGIEGAAAGNNVAGRTTLQTSELLQGLPACFLGMAFLLGVYQVRRVAVSSVRAHFINAGNLKGEIAKPRVMEKCRALGWVSKDDEDQSFDRSDALAGWSYCETLFAAKESQPVDDLFVASERRKREADELKRRYEQPAIPEKF